MLHMAFGQQFGVGGSSLRHFELEPVAGEASVTTTNHEWRSRLLLLAQAHSQMQVGLKTRFAKDNLNRLSRCRAHATCIQDPR